VEGDVVERLGAAEREGLGRLLPEWRMVEGRDAIGRGFVFADFSAAFGFMTRVAMLAEAQGHHPEWSNVWNRVEIVLTTHDAGGLSARDLALAGAVDRLVAG
jgi:4a-hydroxytetrahydrobiopterin dehydratase